MSSFFEYTDLTAMSLPALVEMAGQISALLSYVQLIDTPHHVLPRRLVTHAVESNTSSTSRRRDDLQRNALGRKRRKTENP
jgi:hypothetical protein